jgi:hypothetical protein
VSLARACALASLVAAGCNAAGVPIVDPEHVSVRTTEIDQSELEAIGGTIRDVVALLVPSLLDAPPGPVHMVRPSALGGGTLTIDGTAEPTADAQTFTLTLTYDAYQTSLLGAVAYPSWRFSSATPATLTFAFARVPMAPGARGSIDGSFTGTLTASQSRNDGDVDARLTISGFMLADDVAGTTWNALHVGGVIYSPTSGYYANDAVFSRPFN